MDGFSLHLEYYDKKIQKWVWTGNGMYSPLTRPEPLTFEDFNQFYKLGLEYNEKYDEDFRFIVQIPIEWYLEHLHHFEFLEKMSVNYNRHLEMRETLTRLQYGD